MGVGKAHGLDRGPVVTVEALRALLQWDVI
jgi:hypothetical protein